jgi:hypothetical protein
MAFDLAWTVKYGDIGGLTDITSYVTDFVVDLNANIGSAGRSTCQITINNNGGQFTPNGSGTYASVNWFKQAVVISCTGAGLTESVFVGLIQDFEIIQASPKQSVVSIQGLDFLSIAGRSSNQLLDTGGGYTLRLNTFVDSFFNPSYAYAQTAATPTMGSTTSLNSRTTTTMVTDTVTACSTSGLTQGTLGDWLNNQALPTGPATAYATNYTITSDRWFWNCDSIDSTLNRTTRAYTTTMVDGSSALTTGQVPFDQINVGFQQDELTNQCYANPLTTFSPLAAVTSTNTTSQNEYGVRARSYATCIPSTFFNTITYGNQFMNTVANFWANRYGTVRYIPDRITTSYKLLRARAVDDGAALQAFIRLLSSGSAVWNRQAITYKGAGMASSATFQTVNTGRRIYATPSDTRIELTLVAGVDNQSFQLDSSTYGVLDTNRLA